VICPKDYTPCMDDLCYGGGCIEMGGESMLAQCKGCGLFCAEELLSCMGTCPDCAMGDDEDRDWEEEFYDD
jgi:hypothetical protein